MKTGWILFRKEWLDFRRSYKAVWVPLVFLVLGISQPVSSYLLPDLLKSAGNLPEGSIMQIPVPQPMEVLAGTLSNFSSVGLLVLVLAAMSAVAGERTSGAAELVMAKPVSALAYIVSKWLAYVLLSAGSLLLGYLGAWYYTDQLIGPVDAGRAFAAFGLYALWVSVYLSLTLLLSARLRSAAASAAGALGAAALLGILSGSLPKWFGWSPGRLTAHVRELLLTGAPGGSFGLCLGVSIGLLLLMTAGAVWFFRRNSYTAANG